MKKSRGWSEKRIAILIEDHYQVLEVWYPYLRLQEEGIAVEFIGPEKKIYVSKEGYPAKASAAMRDIAAGDYDGVIIPGGYAPDILRRYPDVIHFVREIHRKNKLIAAICHGGWVLASAEILTARNVTGFFAIKDDLIHAGAFYRDQEVVVDGNLVTSRKPEDLPAFCREILRFLRK